jgi:1,4-alpha-glucan branching enzyme
MNNKIDINGFTNYHTGKLYNSYEYFGAHLKKHEDGKGVYFTVWAPNALGVSLVGTFNFWNDQANPMERLGDTGIWQCFFDNIGEGEVYKYKIFKKDGTSVQKADPYGFFAEKKPGTSSVVADLDGYDWKDRKWLEKRGNHKLYDGPLNIYEIHLGSWKIHEDESHLTYRELADELVPYLKEMNYNYVEIMPLMEHPFDGSWGYQITGYYAITSRYGKPDDLKYLIDKCHLNNIGVILDWVPGHFCRDEQGLLNFDGAELYGHIDHPNWGTKKFNFGRSEVRNFLISNALFYFDKYHVDGLRVDGVTSILHLNFGMEEQIYRNREGGTDDLDGIDFLKELNVAVFSQYPFAIMAAEESTDWPLVTGPVDEGGLGFNFKWNMGWMNDTISYVENDFLFRKDAHDKITFSLHYAFSENFILPFSHDEVVHGKKTLIDKSWGTYEEKFKNLKLLAMYQMTHPGKKLNFMGNEIGQFMEWRYYEAVEWFMLNYPMHDSHKDYIKKLNKLYMNEKSLWEQDNSWDGFQWIDADNRDQSMFSYIRWGHDDFIVTVLNFTPNVHEEAWIQVPQEGQYRVILNSDDDKYNGTGTTYKKYIKSQKDEYNPERNIIKIKVAGLSGIMLKKKKNKKRG